MGSLQFWIQMIAHSSQVQLEESNQIAWILNCLTASQYFLVKLIS